MPDWIIHLGIAYFIAEMLKIKDIRSVLLGAILPDISRIDWLLIDIFKINPVETYTYFEPFHTPFIIFFISIFISLFNEKPRNCFYLIFFGAIIHFILDAAQTNVGYGEMLFYPFSFYQLSLNLFWPESTEGMTLTLLCGVVLLVALIKSHKITNFSLNKQYLKMSIPLLLLIIFFPIFTQNMLVQSNSHNLDFFLHPQKYEGKEVAFSYSQIISQDPIIVEEMGATFDVITNQELKKGDWISMMALYKNGAIYPTEIYIHNQYFKPLFSLIGLAFFILIWKSYNLKLKAKS